MPVTNYQFADNAASLVAGGAGGLGTSLNSGDTAMLVTAGTGTVFPATTNGPFMCMLGSLATSWELIQVSSRSTDSFNPILRGQEGTTAQTWPVGTPIQQVATSGTQNAITAALAHNLQATYNVMDYGAKNDGATDDTSAWNAAIAAGVAAGGNCKIYLPGGAGSVISSPLTALSAQGMHIVGDGRSASRIKPSASFSGAQMISITADFCGVRDLLISYASTSTSSNPTGDAILVSGARHCHIRDIEAYYINGYLAQILATGSQSAAGAMVESIHVFQCAGGIHLLGNTAQGFTQQAWLCDLNIEQVTTLDGILVEDANDVLITNFGGAAVQGSATNSTLHIKGASSSVFIVNCDIGVISTASAPTVLIESGVNGSPSRVSFNGGVIQAGTYCVQATAGTNFLFNGVQFRAFITIGLGLEFAGAMYASVVACEFSSSATTGSSGRYDINIPNSSARVTIAECIFRDTIGAGAGQVNATMNLGGGRVYVIGNDFEGATTVAQAFQGSAVPGLLVENANINPIGSITVTVGASPYTVPSKPYPTNYWVTGGTVTSIVYDGVSTNLTSGSFHVAAGKSIVITYSVAPTVTGYGE